MIETLSILVHAGSKTGKTTMAATSPPPILALDAEGGWKFIAGSPFLQQIYGRPLVPRSWDPSQGPPPAHDGTWDVCVVIVRDWHTVQLVDQWLQSGQHHFRSLVVDSISEIQRRCKANLVGTEQMKMQDWGQLLSLMDDKIRGFRDLTMHPTNPLQVVMFIAETREKNGKYKPYMQGQIEVALPYWMDIVGYLFVQEVLDENGQPTEKMRRMLISPHPEFEAGERVQGRLGQVVDRPNVSQMLLQVYPHLQEQAQQQQVT